MKKINCNENTSRKNKHMNIEDRKEIQDCLFHGMTFKDIAKRIGKDQTTVSKEVKKHLAKKESSVTRKNADNKPCPLLLKAPFVCNPCKKNRIYCPFEKQVYSANNAQAAYETLLSESREGIPLNKETFYEIDTIIKEGIKKGQRLYHIIQSNNLGISISTAYRHLHKGYLSVNKLDFPRVVKFKKRKQKRADSVPQSAKKERTYADFLSYIDENDISHWVEMDTVIGEIGGKVIVTFDFTFCNFMFGLLVDDKTSASVTKKVRSLKEYLVSNKTTFGLLLESSFHC